MNQVSKMKANSNLEIELKLHVPNASVEGVKKSLARGKVNRVELRALYFDTIDMQLALKQISLRLRQEKNRWVQTLKINTNSFSTRIEYNHFRPHPELDLDLYKNTVAEKFISQIKSALNVRCETFVERQYRNIRKSSNLVEIAFDRGYIRSSNQELPISEIEFELKRGSKATLFSVVNQWQKDHQLILDVRSKAERGDLLWLLENKPSGLQKTIGNNSSQIESQAIDLIWPARSAKALYLKPEMTAAQGLNCVMAECLDQIIRNASVLAEVDTANVWKLDTTEQVHQLRVGIRRIRTAWSFFDGLCQLPDSGHREILKHYFGLLGGSRDQSVLQSGLMPALIAAGQPLLKMELRTNEIEPSSISKDSSFQSCILNLCAFIETSAFINAEKSVSGKQVKLKKCLLLRLKKWHQKIIFNSKAFAQLPPEDKHELRKRVKKLRYALQFTIELLPDQKLKSYQKELAVIQNHLGEADSSTKRNTLE
jgi:triphosphatase